MPQWFGSHSLLSYVLQVQYLGVVSYRDILDAFCHRCP